MQLFQSFKVKINLYLYPICFYVYFSLSYHDNLRSIDCIIIRIEFMSFPFTLLLLVKSTKYYFLKLCTQLEIENC